MPQACMVGMKELMRRRAPSGHRLRVGEDSPFNDIHWFNDEQKFLADCLLTTMSSPLHHSIGHKRPCPNDDPCKMCVNAARLAVQDLPPAVVELTVGKMHRAIGWECPPIPHHTAGEY